MYRQLAILSVIIVAALSALSVLGYHAVVKWAQGLEGVRLGEFAEVAEQIREDVKRKLDEFIEVEQERKYTDYLHYYVPENVVTAQQQLPLLRSPLSNQFSNSFAYGYFQVEPDGRIVTPYAQNEQTQAGGPEEELASQVEEIERNVKDNVLPSVTTPVGTLRLREAAAQSLRRNEAQPSTRLADRAKGQTPDAGPSKGKVAREDNYAIKSLQEQPQRSQVFRQQREIATLNTARADLRRPQRDEAQSGAQAQVLIPAPQAVAQPSPTSSQNDQGAQTTAPMPAADRIEADASDTVQIRIEPFVPIVVPGDSNEPSVFGGQIFLLRHVQIEDSHLLQGFQLDEARLVEEVQESATRFVREGMTFALPQIRPDDTEVKTAYAAILDFGFGDLVLHLKEIDPGWITKRITGLQRVYVGIIGIVAVAVALALGSLWHNVRAQAQLAQKKDDFISAVSHELRTPLTSIRMYAEMLEKNWVKSTEKLAEYYRSMRQESERLSRLVENVLDFSRIQKGRKKYAFQLGDVNACVMEVVAMMRPYAEQHGFTIEANLAALGEVPFDKDAVTQIVVNLIDNAVKYAHTAQDKTIAVRTAREGRFTIIEVEDHGPGIPHRQRRKVFEQFYRYGAELQPNRSQTTGTGLGLALVKRFAEAHDGFVEIRSAQPSGVTLKVGLAAHSR
ncbi:MAG: HAMP domain-containing histidine kinase [Sedimentisphaerales bacterium]|nr:HAMP domain-containing histidine kinase [Sedimentisphaerales bacterium]